MEAVTFQKQYSYYYKSTTIMKKYLLSFVLFVSATSYGFAQQINDPNVELRTAKNFHAINLSSAFDVFITQSNEESVAVSAADIKDRERIIVEVKNGVLHVGFDSKGVKWGNGNKKLKAYISFKQIDALTVSGACDVFISGTLKANELTLRQSGASDLKGKDLVTEICDARASGASDIKITVNKELSANASGASDVKYKGSGVIRDIKSSGSSSVRKV